MKLLYKISIFAFAMVIATSIPYAAPLDRLEGVLYDISDFAEEDLARHKQHLASSQFERFSQVSTLQVLEKTRIWVSDLFEDVQHIKGGDLSLDAFLNAQLTNRLKMLMKTTDDVLKAFSAQSSSSVRSVPFPMDPEVSEHLFGSITEHNREVQKTGMKEWEYRQLVIKHAFHALPPREMTPETRRLLQLSPSLWPLLRFETYELGHQDQAGGYGAILWLTKLLHDSSNPYSYAALDYHKAVIQGKGFVIRQHKRGYEKVLPSLDGELYRAETDRSVEVEVENLMLGGKGKSFTILQTPLEAKTWGDPLQRPDFLFKAAAVPARVVDPSFSKAMALRHKSAPVVLEELPAVEPETATASVELVKKIADLPVEGIDEEKTEGAVAEERAITPMPVAEFIWPRGLRLLSGSLLDNPCPIQDMTSSTQGFMDQLFDSALVGNLTFKQFEKHWARVGGTIEGQKSGGSHRHLIAPNGQPLWGTFDHGGFGKGTVKYLQAAFWWAGYRPSVDAAPAA